MKHVYENYRMMRDHIAPAQAIPVVKADAYGHGAKRVVRYFYERGVQFFAVSLLEEALELKEIAEDIDVLVMGAVHKEDFDVLSRHNILFTVTSRHLFDAAKQFAKPLRFHMKIDTGMHRLGFKDYSEALEVASEVQNISHLSMEGVYTHFATADCDEAYVKRQISLFESFLQSMPFQPQSVHVSNTSAIMKYENDFPYTTHARLGIAMYGASLEGDLFPLKTTYTLKSRIVEIKSLQKGDKLGYSITYEAKQNERIGVLPIGYADGMIRKNQGGYVTINNTRCEIVGRICMDQMFVRIEDDMRLGDEVVLMGEDPHIDEVARRLDTINYEVFCQIGKRVPRIYTE